MKSFFGAFNHAGQALDQAGIVAMRQILQRQVPGPVSEFGVPGLALGQADLWQQNRAQADSTQPVSPHRAALFPLAVIGEPGARLALVGDIRLDNRVELEALVGRGNTCESGDEALLLQAWRRWGAETIPRLLGDFAFALWDEGAGSLYLVRDPIGIRSLYYCQRDGNLLFSNDLRCLMAHRAVQAEIDEHSLASYLRDGELYLPQHTFYRDVFRLAPATFQVAAGDLRAHVYWRAEDSPSICLGNDQDYVDTLYALLEDAVRVRLHGDHAMAAQLSGGLDSSAVTVLAARMLHAQGRGLHTFNWLHHPQGTEDAARPEFAHSRRVSQAEGLEHEYVEASAGDLLEILRSMDLFALETTEQWYELALRRRARALDIGVVLSGWGGDELISNYGRRAPFEQFWGGHPVLALRTLYSEACAGGGGLRALPAAAWHQLLRPFRNGNVHPQLDYAVCVEPGLKSMVAALPDRLGLHSKSVQQEQLALYRIGHLQARIESWANAGRAAGLEYRYPLLDRRVVEFSLGLPARLFRQGGERRWIHRAVCRKLLPQELLTQPVKVESSRAARLLVLCREALADWSAEIGDEADAQEFVSRQCLGKQLTKEQESHTKGPGLGAQRLLALFKNALVAQAATNHAVRRGKQL